MLGLGGAFAFRLGGPVALGLVALGLCGGFRAFAFGLGAALGVGLGGAAPFSFRRSRSAWAARSRWTRAARSRSAWAARCRAAAAPVGR